MVWWTPKYFLFYKSPVLKDRKGSLIGESDVITL